MSEVVLRTVPSPSATFRLAGMMAKVFQGCYWNADTGLIMAAEHNGFVVELDRNPDNPKQWEQVYLLFQLFGGSIVTPNMVIDNGAVYCRETGEYRFNI